jgi:archaellum component FlaF (FlaF/FlaG flagellin family)
MGTSLAALLIMAVFFTGVILMYRTTLAGNVAVSSAIREASDRAADRVRTNLRIVKLQTDKCEVAIEIQNEGTIAIDDYDDMDVIVTMDTFEEELKARRFQYNDAFAALPQILPSVPNSWSLAIDADVFPYEPSTLNPGESGTLTVNWNLTAQDLSPLGYGEARAVTIGAANGSTTDFAPPRGNLMSPC